MDWNFVGSILLNIALLIPVVIVAILAVATYKEMVADSKQR